LGVIAMRIIGKVRLWKILLASTVLGICAAFPAYMSIPEQCVLCRAECVKYRVLGLTFLAGLREDGDVTRWYATHRPPHDHIWHCSHSGCLPDRNFFGLPLTLYMMKGHPVLHLKTVEELRFVKNADEATLQQFFADAASPDVGVQLRASDTVRKRLAEIK
jgi:hypothetical protein